MTFPAKRLRALTLAAVLLTPMPASAAFETWRFAGAPLPFRLEDVRFSRDDRRDAVVQSVRDMAKRQLLDSGLFHAKAGSGVTVELLSVETAAAADPDGNGIGRAAVLYRVGDARGRILFNDRIETRAHVGVRESLPMQQSTVRAARYRAFTRNLDAFARRFWLAAAAHGGNGGGIGRVVLSQPLETPERTADFAARVQADLEVLTAGHGTPDAAPAELRVTALTFRETSAPGAETVRAEADLSLAAVAADGTPLWTGSPRGQGEADRHDALLRGLSPTDAALTAALQTALRPIAADLADAVAEHARLKFLAARRHLPFGLAGIDAGANLRDDAALARLRVWNATGHPFAAAWSDDAPPLRIRVDALSTHVKKTGKKSGIVEISATYSVFDGAGKPLLTTRQDAASGFDAVAPGGLESSGRAMRVALAETWNGLLDQIAPLAAPLTAKDDSEAAR